jgi:hypothetical protein
VIAVEHERLTENRAFLPKATGCDIEIARVFAKATGFAEDDKLFAPPPCCPHGLVQKWLFGDERCWMLDAGKGLRAGSWPAHSGSAAVRCLGGAQRPLAKS